MNIYKLLLVNALWSTSPPAPWDANIVVGLCNEAHAYWKQVSFGQIDLQCTAVTQFIRVSDEGDQATASSGGSLRTHGAAPLAALGYDVTKYHFVYYLTPMTYGYDFPGWIQYGDPLLGWKFIHEIGHHLGLGHQGKLSSGYTFSGYDVHMKGPARVAAVGGSTSPMAYNHAAVGLSAPEKLQLNLISSQKWVGPVAQTYTLTPLNQPGGSLYAVKVMAPPHVYTVEYRTPVGVDSALPGTGIVVYLDGYGEIPGSDNGFAVVGLWGSLFDDDGKVAIDVIGPGRIRVRSTAVVSTKPMSKEEKPPSLGESPMSRRPQ